MIVDPPRSGLQAHGVARVLAARPQRLLHVACAADSLAQDLADTGLPVLQLHSAAPDRATYLQRPDLGRRLDAASLAQLQSLDARQHGRDLAFVIADGLSALKVLSCDAPGVRPLKFGLYNAMTRHLGWHVEIDFLFLSRLPRPAAPW